MIDGYGARVSLSAISFISWVFVINALMHTFVMRLKDEKNIIQRLAKYGKKIFIFGGSLDYFTYITVVWAFTKAPIPIVGALRETSILFSIENKILVSLNAPTIGIGALVNAHTTVI